MNKLKRLWSNLRSSFWFMPSLIVAASIAFAKALIEALEADPVSCAGEENVNQRWISRGNHGK